MSNYLIVTAPYPPKTWANVTNYAMNCITHTCFLFAISFGESRVQTIHAQAACYVERHCRGALIYAKASVTLEIRLYIFCTLKRDIYLSGSVSTRKSCNSIFGSTVSDGLYSSHCTCGTSYSGMPKLHRDGAECSAFLRF